MRAQAVDQDRARTRVVLRCGQESGYFAGVPEVTPYVVATQPGGFGLSSFAGPGLDGELRILVTKTMETFDIVKPPDMP
jgi:hypothetical protein